MNLVLQALHQSTGLKAIDVAEKIEMAETKYKAILFGEEEVNIELSEKLGAIFNISPELFLHQGSRVAYHCTGINSHSNTVYNPNNYVDIQNFPYDLYEKAIEERDKLKEEIFSLKSKKGTQK
jgi:hypothetical protein